MPHFPRLVLHQVLTGESWADLIARPLILGIGIQREIEVTVFFVSFILINSFVLVNIVVGKLLPRIKCLG